MAGWTLMKSMLFWFWEKGSPGVQLDNLWPQLFETQEPPSLKVHWSENPSRENKLTDIFLERPCHSGDDLHCPTRMDRDSTQGTWWENPKWTFSVSISCFELVHCLILAWCALLRSKPDTNLILRCCLTSKISCCCTFYLVKFSNFMWVCCVASAWQHWFPFMKYILSICFAMNY